MRRRKLVTFAVAGIAALAGAVWTAIPASLGSGVVIPPLSQAGARGQAAFDGYCASCHGTDAGGTNSGPPLVHKIYHPGHHADMAFVLAVRRGSRAHHWSFGDMPPVQRVTDAELADIISFVREVQQANGIF
ncbi:MAG TPA: cytochrome c [Thermohalobaculum sp.]|nr:cytochrome c [Thermohalobaculum sp.]